jgi:aminoglycoside phosphotransferase (APT) family kinase protein
MPSQEDLVRDAGTPGLDLATVEPWLVANVPGFRSPADFSLIAAGGSNLTYLVTGADGTRTILRRPPVGGRLESAHDILREARIIGGLGRTDIPVARVHTVCEDPDVCEAPFAVLSYESGIILRNEETAHALGPDGCRQAGFALFETLAQLHLLDPADAGLADLAKPDQYVERQLKRWSRQVEQIVEDPHPLFAELHGRLAANVPAAVDDRAHLVHGDYHIDNAIFDDTPKVIALLDWELSTLGDPVADLAWALMFWNEGPDEVVKTSELITTAPGFPSRAEVTERYADVTGYDLSPLPYHRAFSFWKMACLQSGSLHRIKVGTGGGASVSRKTDLDESVRRITRILELADEAAAAAGI